jgi:hypothetical protein
VKKEQREKTGRGPKEKRNQVSLVKSQPKAIVECGTLLSMMGVVVVVVVQRQRSIASLASNAIPLHRLSVLVRSNLTRALRRLIHRRGLPITISRWRRLKLSSSMVTHILHGIALLRWIRGIMLLIVCIVVLREGSSSLATTGDEPAVVGEWL